MRLSWLKRTVVPLILALGVPLLLTPVATRGFHPDADKSGIIVVLIFIVGVPLLVGYLGLKSLTALVCFNIAIAVSVLVVSAAFAYRPDVSTQFGSMLLIFYLFAVIVINFIGIFTFGLRSCIPFAMSLLCVILLGYSNSLGHRLRLHVFRQRLPQYEAAVPAVETQITDGPVFLKGEEVPKPFRHLAYWIHADKTEQNVLIVTFFWGGGFPVKHTAFAYISDGKVPGPLSRFQKEWPHIFRINQNWFRVVD